MNRALRFIASLVAVALVGCAEQSKSGGEVVVKEGLQFNESTLPYNGGLLVANFGTQQLNPLNDEGMGYISFFDNTSITPFIPADGSLSAPKGMLIKGDYLLICDVNRVVAYNLTELTSAPQVLRFPEGELFVNDIVSAGDDIYISVTNSGNIFRLDGAALDSLSTAQLTLWSSVIGANGLVISDSKMYIASYPADGVTTPANVIYVIRDLLNPTPVPLTTKAGQWDGMVISEDGKRLYSSSWSPAEIIELELSTGTMTTLDFKTEFIGAADFTLLDGKLYIPDLVNSVLIIKEL